MVKDTFLVEITNCSSSTAWYNDKIGTVHRVTNEFFFPKYTVISKKENKRGLYPMIDFEDAKIVPETNIAKLIKFIKKFLQISLL